jgi:WD40 repeat protein
VSADGKTVAVPVTDKAGTQVLLWEWETSKDPRPIDLGGRRRPLDAMALSPDGKRIAFVDDLYEKPEIWDTTTGKKVVTLGRRVFTRNLTFTPDGTKLLTADEGNGGGRNWSGGLVLWDAATGNVDTELSTPGVGVRWVSVSRDGKYAAGGTDYGISVWDLVAKKELGAESIAHRGAVHVVAGPGTILTFSDDHTAKLWDATTGAFKQVFRHSHWIRGAAVSPDGTKVATNALADEMSVWDAATGQELFKLPGHGSMGGDRSVVFSADGSKIVSYGDDYFLRVTDVKTGKAVREFAVRPKGLDFPDEDTPATGRDRMMMLSFYRGALSPDGRWLGIPTMKSYAVFETDTGKEVHSLAVDRAGHTAPTFSPDGRFLLTLGQAPAVETKLIDGRTQHKSAENNPVTLWDLAAGKPKYQISIPTSFDGKVVFRPDGQVFAVKLFRESDIVGFFDAGTGKLVGELVNPTKFGDIAFSPDGKRIYAAMRDTSVLVYDVPELKKP